MRERVEDPEEGAAALLLQVQCNFLSPSSSFVPSFLPSLSSQSSPLSKLEPGSLPPSLSPSACSTGTIIALRTARAQCGGGGGGFCCMHLQFSLSTPLPRSSHNYRTNERPTFKEEDRNRGIGNLSKVYLPQAVKGTSTAWMDSSEMCSHLCVHSVAFCSKTDDDLREFLLGGLPCS